ncbi:MAG: LacI family DNA-binding transcriptional regulator [Planctomycetota bacterium]
MPVTLKQVAQLAGTSVPAASLVLNRKGDGYSRDTVRRIQQAAKELGYRPNHPARSLAKRRTQCIGLAYGRPADYVERSRMVSALVQELAQFDYELMLIPATGSVDRWAYKLHDGRVDGVLVTHPMPSGLDHFIEERNLPAVLMNLRSERALAQAYFDDVGGTRDAMDHLRSLGHERISYFSAPKHDGDHYSATDRRDTYTAEMRAAGLERYLEVVISENEDDAFAHDIAARPVSERPTAVLVYCDHDTRYLIHALNRLGLQVPADISVVSFTESRKPWESIVGLTAVTTPSDELAERAVSLLMQQIDAPGMPTPPAVVLKEELVLGQSSSRRSTGNGKTGSEASS